MVQLSSWRVIALKGIPYVSHIDMDAFFASIEQAANPTLKGKPIAVTGIGKRHSVVTSASYEAKRLGVKSGMAFFEALKLCPDLIAVGVQSKKYGYISKEIMKMMTSVSPRVMVASVDEAYIDLSFHTKLEESINRFISFKRDLKERFGITASVGISVNPIISKIASDYSKPNGFVVVKDGMEREFLNEIPVKDVPGIGKHTLIKLESMGYKMTGELLEGLEKSPMDLYTMFGNAFMGFLQSLTKNRFSRKEFFKEERPKSVGHSMTLSGDINDFDLIVRVTNFLSARVIYRLGRYKMESSGVSLFLRYADRSSKALSKRLNFTISSIKDMTEITPWLISSIWNGTAVRAIGISCWALSEKKNQRQLSLFEKERELLETVLEIERKFGEYSIFPGNILFLPDIRKLEKPSDLHYQGFCRREVSC
ncbi:DNA polymerase [Mesotoga sp. Brook.08.YT.4.2.5.1]|nr:DNA polymerase [Mesotoga sp. Brook.08.YT.4.2.5.1]RAM58520.1 DNA polymerase [Mesotoga sp. SC_4PWL113PWK15]RAM60124.1 DNA polymerase [Mesotoga sp. SC_4PWA21]RDI93020.1 DNA polymerase [Mesotoga sp. Brook.08.YT.4.2.5.2.]